MHRLMMEDKKSESYAMSDNACYVAFELRATRAMAVNLNLGSHGPFDPGSYHAPPRQCFSPHDR